MSEPATPHPPEHAPGPAAHAADPWPMVSDAVMRGLNHALSNRAAALSGLVSLVEPAEPPGQEVAELLGRETARLEETLRLYCLLARGQPRPAEPVLLADALALHAHHAGLADAPCAVEGDPAALPPVIVPAGALVHALTLLLGALALHAQDGSMEGRAAPGAVLRLAGGAGVVRLTGQSARGAGAGVPPLAPNAVAAATGRLLRDAGVVTARESAGLVRYTVELRALGGAGSAPG